MDQDVLISSQSASTSHVSKKHFTDCRSDSKRNKVTPLMNGVHAEWTNTAWSKVKSIVIGVIVGVYVFVVVSETRIHSIHTADTLFNQLHATPKLPFPKLGAAKQIPRALSELQKSASEFPLLSGLSSHSVLFDSNGNVSVNSTQPKQPTRPLSHPPIKMEHTLSDHTPLGRAEPGEGIDVAIERAAHRHLEDKVESVGLLWCAFREDWLRQWNSGRGSAEKLMMACLERARDRIPSAQICLRSVPSFVRNPHTQHNSCLSLPSDRVESSELAPTAMTSTVDQLVERNPVELVNSIINHILPTFSLITLEFSTEILRFTLTDVTILSPLSDSFDSLGDFEDRMVFVRTHQIDRRDSNDLANPHSFG
ncbi:hypothetical protein BLNAU_14460 [Blattamonas nauphoetae]|uniref:Uncharacterized protein n=1 Tax=Blattamonas nauphoetae TaxID=2049346 RepID=A0ABQ9XGW9_9EUKA|nr:hypothetical protein BLNAU_14460 [Blattamonas nauphoetae]